MHASIEQKKTEENRPLIVGELNACFAIAATVQHACLALQTDFTIEDVHVANNGSNFPKPSLQPRLSRARGDWYGERYIQVDWFGENTVATVYMDLGIFLGGGGGGGEMILECRKTQGPALVFTVHISLAVCTFWSRCFNRSWVRGLAKYFYI